MEKEFVPYELAVKLKELGFDEPCFGYYEPNGNLEYIENHIVKDFPFLAKNSEWQDLVAAPTFSQAFRWFREKYTLYSIISTIMHTYPNLEFYFKIQGLNDGTMIDKFNTYEEAELACLVKLIEIVETKR